MNEILQRVQAELAYDQGTPSAEWEVIERLLEDVKTERELAIRWLFERFDGYVVNRARAGIEFLQLRPSEGWSILEKLVASSDPDDRDTALTVLQTLGNEDAARLARPLLGDRWPYIQLEAAVFLVQYYPDDVVAMLGKLLESDSLVIRKKAQELLSGMG